MRRITTLLAALLMALGLTAGPAVAMQPPGEGAKDNFTCDDEHGAPGGHPGAAGLVDATTEDRPTAWNAVNNSADIAGIINVCDK